MTESIIPASALESLPILALRNSVLFPASVVPVNVGRSRSVRLIEDAFGSERPLIGVTAQRFAEAEDPTFDDLHPIGTVARVLKVIRLSSGNYSVVLQGIGRMRIVEPVSRTPYLRARVERLHEATHRDEEIDALSVHLRESARELLVVLPQPPREVSTILDNVQEPGALADLVATHMPVATEAKQAVLETLDLRSRLRRVLELVARQSELHRVKREIATLVQEEMSSSQRELLLRQQLKAIRRELGETEEDDDELERLRERLAKAEPSPEAEKAARRELSRMASMNASSAEYQVAFNYVEWIAELPWKRITPDRIDVQQVRRVLDEDHHGLEEPKKRIVEHAAVRKLRANRRSPILCLVGPPGVGKTSLARSIARATGRELVRISLGGVQDEAEIRGHRRTYVGALPGRLIAGFKKAGSRNPVFVLDEIDKMSADYSGDPGSALLEALDPEQNSAFVDHYLNVAFDLSQVLFVATANNRNTIPGPLLDRMEVIEIAGYTRQEKLLIARDFVIPKQLSDHGLTPERLELTDAGIACLIDEYTNEAGIRSLDKQVASLCRAVAVRLAGGEDVRVLGDESFVRAELGPARHEVQKMEAALHPGVAASLAWTPSGGEMLLVESSKMPGKGHVHLTGQMSDVMKEAAAAAFAYIRSHARQFGLKDDFLSTIDVHIHLPRGSMPKDGPSAGLAIVVSLLSMLKGERVRSDVALAGEISLRGAVLPVIGLKQKCLAAHRAGVTHVILPRRNEPEMEEVPEAIRNALQVHFVSRIDEVPALAFPPTESNVQPVPAPAP